MNICFVSQEYPPETGWGGIGTYVYEMAHALSGQGHKVVVLSRGIRDEGYSCDNGVHVYRILPKYALGNKHVIWRFQKYWEGYRYSIAKKLDELVDKYNIDVVEAPEIRAELVLYQFLVERKHAVVIKLHTPRWLVDKLSNNQVTLRNRIDYFAEKLTISKADIAYSCSKSLLGKCEKYLPKRDYSVVHNPMKQSFRSLGYEKESRISSEVLYVGRFEWRKGVQVFGMVIPHVLSRRQETRFVLLGSDHSWFGGDSLKGYILDQIPDEMRNSVEFSGEVPRDTVREYLTKRPICVLPSLWENFPYTCLEAMASGCAVVGSKNGGMSEMIENGVSGILVDPEDTEEISEAILRLLNDNDLRCRMGQNAGKRITEMFSVNKIVEETLAIYRQAIEVHQRKKIR